MPNQPEANLPEPEKIDKPLHVNLSRSVIVEASVADIMIDHEDHFEFRLEDKLILPRGPRSLFLRIFNIPTVLFAYLTTPIETKRRS